MKIFSLLAQKDKKDFQFILCTHSEHMLNAVSFVLKARLLPKDQVQILHFKHSSAEKASDIDSLQITEDFEIPVPEPIEECISKEFNNTIAPYTL